MEQKGKELEDKQKIDLQAEKFKFKGNQKQFVFNAEFEELAGKINEANAQKDHKKVAQLTDQTKSLLHKRQKLDLSNPQTRAKPAGTQFKNTNVKILLQMMRTTRKLIRSARAAANRKRKQKERERQQQSSKKRCTTPNPGTPNHHLFRGICIHNVFTVLSIFLLFSQVLCFVLVLYWLLVSYNQI